MKKIFKIIILLIFMPTIVLAGREGNATGGQLIGGPSSSGPSNSKYDCVYILGLAEYYGVYGVRVTFFSENGDVAPALMGQGQSYSVDVWRWNSNKAQGTISGEKIYGFEPRTMQVRHGRDYYSRIEYINGKDFYVKYGAYDFYYDTEASKFNPVKGDPLAYLKYQDRTYFKEYFTDENVVKRYAKLANAKVDFQSGKYFILIEPLLVLDRMPCARDRSGGVTGRYTSAELGMLKKEGYNTFDNNTLRTTIFFKALRLESSADVGKYKFNLVEGFSEATNKRNYKPEYVFGQYGYGMSVITGEEVCKEKCGGQPYKIIYRTIDMANPFLGIDGKKRTLTPESNWYGKEDTINTNVYQGTPKYVIKLTPSTIKQIKNDNKKVEYSEIFKKYNADDLFSNSTFKKKFNL